MTQPGPGSPDDGSAFSDSDQDWFERLAGCGSVGKPPASMAEREADALRRALVLQRAPGEADPPITEATSTTARERRWQQLQFRLRREGLSELPLHSARSWRSRAGWAAALAASVLLAAVLVLTMGEGTHYTEPPVMRGEYEVLSLADANPRGAAEALAQELRGMGLAITLHQRGKAYFLDAALDDSTLGAASERLRRLGAKAQPGLLRIEFKPR